MGVEAFISEPTVEALDEAIFRRPAWSDEFELYSFSIGPAIERSRAKLGAVIDRDRLRIAPQLGHPFQAFDHPRSRHRHSGFELEALAGKLIDHGQHPKSASSFQAIGDEACRTRNGRWSAMARRGASPCDPHREAVGTPHTPIVRRASGLPKAKSRMAVRWAAPAPVRRGSRGTPSPHHQRPCATST